MKPAKEWLEELSGAPVSGDLEVLEGRGGEKTLRIGQVFLHSRYRPREEAQRLIDSAKLDPARPVLVLGLGLGYHVKALIEQGVEVAAVERDPAVAKLALEGPLAGCDVLLGVGDAEAIAATDGFKEFAGRVPQVLVHPPSEGLHAAFVQAMLAETSRAALGKERLSIAIVGPMFGGSLPIAGYLQRAFRRLGHRAVFVDNSSAWNLYTQVTEGIGSQKTSGQLANILTNFVSEWTYARVMEFRPDICITLAQAPVSLSFPRRLAKEDIITAFWFVENWRHLTYWQEVAPLYDHFFHIQPGAFERNLDEIGCQHHAVVHTGCDPEIHQPVVLKPDEQSEVGCDISFAGAGYRNRKQIFAGLTDYDFRLWGVGWEGRDLESVLCRPEERFTPEFFAKVVAGTKVNLNLHSSASHDGVDPRCDAVNPRVFEIAACGGFQLCDPCVGLESLFDTETELPVYRDLPEMRAKIDHFLAHPEERAAIAARARERALRDHTYDRRAQQMLDQILQHSGPRMLRKGVLTQRTVSEVAELEGQGSELGAFLAGLPPETLFSYDNMVEQLEQGSSKPTYPEQIFTFLQEVRRGGEALLDKT